MSNAKNEPVRLPVLQLERPRKRGDCVDGPRPCPWFDCAHHLWAVTDSHGRPSTKKQGKRFAIVPFTTETCALDIAERQAGRPRELSFAIIGEVLGVSDDMASRIFRRAVRKLRRVGVMVDGGEAELMEKRVLARRQGEDMEAAIRRARSYAWWTRVASARPTNAGRAWVWVLKPAKAHACVK